MVKADAVMMSETDILYIELREEVGEGGRGIEGRRTGDIEK